MVTNQYYFCEKCGRETLHRFGGLCPKCEWEKREKRKNTKINWKPFKQLAEMRGKGAISREHFIANWRVAQRDQGIKAEGK
jgi:hypothetical protein